MESILLTAFATYRRMTRCTSMRIRVSHDPDQTLNLTLTQTLAWDCIRVLCRDAPLEMMEHNKIPQHPAGLRRLLTTVALDGARAHAFGTWKSPSSFRIMSPQGPPSYSTHKKKSQGFRCRHVPTIMLDSISGSTPSRS